MKICFKQNQDLPEVSPDDAGSNLVYGILAYCSILFLIPLLKKTDSAFVRFHVNQGGLLFVLGLLITVLSKLPGIGGCIFFLGFLACIVLMINGIRTVCEGKVKRLPYIGDYDLFDFEQ